MRTFLVLLTLVFALNAQAQKRTPNIVIIFIDDMGYADIGPFGAKGYATPHLDRMAKGGRKFTDFYVTQAVCSASRAGLLTGCYNVRVGILGALGPAVELHVSTVLLVRLLRSSLPGFERFCELFLSLGHV